MADLKKGKHAAVFSRLAYRAIKLKGQADAVYTVMGPLSPIYMWLRDASEDIASAIAELERRKAQR